MHCASCTKEFANLHLTSKQKKVLENELEDGSSLCPKLLSPSHTDYSICMRMCAKIF